MQAHHICTIALAFSFSQVGACGDSASQNNTDGGMIFDDDSGTGNSDASSTDASSGICGNGTRTSDEACDDGNIDNGDGCTSACVVEDNFACPTENSECIQIVTCGNGRIEGPETCDDRNTNPNDGCSDTCQIEQGWSCPLAGTACVASMCGDGFVAGFEICDDGNSDINDGCDAQCNLEEGFHCPMPNSMCLPTNCGDGLTEGTEECDDQNAEVGDGCTPFCKREPQCTGGTCLPVCGDSVLQAPETCDDGNTVSGDGCRTDCSIEQGFTCQEVQSPNPLSVDLPVTIRDFVASCGTGSRLPDDAVGAVAPFGHPDFECYNGALLGMVANTLDANGKPVRVDNALTFSDASFSKWYTSDNDYNRTLASSLNLTPISGGAYQFDSNALYPATGRGFDTVDCGGGNLCEVLHNDSSGTGDQNFHFTTETRWWFEYAGNEVLAFSGDDDVWVFINNTLAVDIGGVHGRENGTVDLGVPANATALGLTIGGIYEGVVFHAERHTTRSQYRLTLTNFNQAPSLCEDACGDAIVSSREVCDLGLANNGIGDGSDYGGCKSDCTLEPYCGDGIVDDAFGEICDDGLNLGGSASDCAPGCQQLGARCGDNIVQTENAEECDDGNTADGDGCSAICEFEIIID